MQDRVKLRRFAQHALSEYDLGPSRLTLLTAKEHAVFRLDALGIDAIVRDRYALRIYLPAAHDEASVHTEIEWLVALRRDTGLAVPEPVMAKNGRYLIHVDDLGDHRVAALFRWVSGRRRKASLTQQAMVRVGKFVGQLHDHSTRFVPNSGDSGQHWDWARVFGGDSPVAPGSTRFSFDAKQRMLLDDVSATVKSTLATLGRDRTVWGMIHGDLHSSNYLFRGADVGAIDFEDCGWGVYIYDLAVILDELYAEFPVTAEAQRLGLITGYRQVRALSADHEALLDVLVAMRLAELVRWHAASDDPLHHTVVPQFLNDLREHAARLINT